MESESESPEDFAESMKDINALWNHDPEAKHSVMDAHLINLLRTLGYGAGCNVFEDAKKF